MENKLKVEDWWKRISRRSDMTRAVTHLTKEAKIDGKDLSALEVLVKILKEKKLKGSTTKSGFIVGNMKAVCFQETPLYSLSENIIYEEELEENSKNPKVRYRPFGLSFDKQYIYEKGGRPVIYDKTNEAKEYLTREQYWRIVSYDLSDDDKIIDWTHEREWRVPGDLKFNLGQVSVVVKDYDDYQELKKMCKKEKINLDDVSSIIVLQDILY